MPRQILWLFLCGGITQTNDTLAKSLAKRTTGHAIISLTSIDEQSLCTIKQAWDESAEGETVVIIAPNDMILRVIRSIGTERCRDFLHYTGHLTGEVSIAIDQKGEVQIQFG